MAESLVARLSLDDVRASVKRAQTEGRKFVTRLRKDATAMVNRRPIDVLSDARKRATKTVEQLDAEQRRLRTLVVDRLTGPNGEQRIYLRPKVPFGAALRAAPKGRDVWCSAVGGWERGKVRRRCRGSAEPVLVVRALRVPLAPLCRASNPRKRSQGAR